MLAFSTPLEANIMAKPDPTAIVKRFVFEVQQNGRVELLKELVAEDFVDHSDLQNHQSGPAHAAGLVNALHLALTDIKVEILQCISEGTTVATNKVIRGVQKGEFLGRPATGKPVEMGVMDFIVVIDGKLKEHWATRGELLDI